MFINIADTLSKVASEYGERTGIIEARSGRCFTFGQLDEQTNRYVSFFSEQGVGIGSRVILMVKPSADFICLTFALFRLGSPVILIDPGMGFKNLLRCISRVKPDYLVGIPQAVLLSRLVRKPFKSVKKSFSCGSWPGLTGRDIRKSVKNALPSKSVFNASEESLAAIIFTTGSTGPPKGVRFEHSIFAAQLKHIREYYQIGPDDIDQPGFPLFGLFSIGLGASAVIPDMDATRPAQVDPARFVESILKYKATYSFGSPAIWNVVSRYCQEKGITCPSLKKILMAGAPVSGELIERVYSLMEDDGQVFTPYGATESLPSVSIEGREIIKETWPMTVKGEGTCVGRPLPGIAVKIIEPSEQPFEDISCCCELPNGSVGEIIVKGDVVTRAYDHNEQENRHSKIKDGEAFWHRMGDVGYFDEHARLWFCGRKAHRVHTGNGIMYTICCEAIINNHPDVMRSALVGIDRRDGWQEPVLILELNKGCKRPEADILKEAKEIAEHNELTETIRYVLVHPSFPVDIRHNAKIFREKLKVWAQEKISIQQ